MSFDVYFNEDSEATLLGRVTARNGSGSATGVDGEGNWVQRADVSSISYSVFDLESPTTVFASGSLTVSNVILDSPVTANTIWTKDSIGYNFIHDLAASNFPTGGSVVRVEYKITFSGGNVVHGSYQGPVCGISTS